jgi:hypothetical protein
MNYIIENLLKHLPFVGTGQEEKIPVLADFTVHEN